MQINGVSHAGMTAIHRGLNKLDRAADTIAKLPIESDPANSNSTKSSDMVKSLISAKEAKLEIQAGAKIIGIHDELLGTLLDVKA